MNKQRLVLLAGLSVIFLTFLSFRFPKNADAALSNASITLGNSRLSYKAGVAGGTSGSSLVTISSSGFPDNNTSHLFPGDILCFTDAGQNGCIGDTNYTVSSIIDSTHFNLTAPLANTLDTSGYAVASQSGSWTIRFTTNSIVPSDGSIRITIPMADNAFGDDGIPDSSSSVATSGFDLNGIVAGDIAITGCTDADWITPVVLVAGSGTSDHTITISRQTSACAASTQIVITITGNGIVNPAPVTSGHVQGTADVYGITLATRNGSGNTIDSSVPRAAPIEAVLISTTVDESLSFVVAGLAAGTYCGNSTITTTATSVPWGHLAATNTFYNAAQQLTVSTNALSGYSVTIQENDQMGKDGNVCTGTAPSAGNFTFGSGTCIRDTLCSGSNCSESTSADWTNATGFPGLGYSLDNQSGTDATFLYGESGRAFSAKQLADKQGGETPQVIMTNNAPVSADSVYVCYRLTVPGNQPSGYYYNIAKYTVTATF